MYRYDGSGAFYPDVPARDLTDDEVKELGIVRLLKDSRHYEYVSDSEHPRMAARAEKAAEAASAE